MIVLEVRIVKLMKFSKLNLKSENKCSIVLKIEYNMKGVKRLNWIMELLTHHQDALNMLPWEPDCYLNRFCFSHHGECNGIL